MPMLDCFYNSYYNINILNNINNTIYSHVKNLKDEIKRQAKEYKKEYETVLSKSNENYVKYQYELYIDYKVTYNRNNIISIPIESYEFTGGAHVMTKHLILIIII